MAIAGIDCGGTKVAYGLFEPDAKNGVRQVSPICSIEVEKVGTIDDVFDQAEADLRISLARMRHVGIAAAGIKQPDGSVKHTDYPGGIFEFGPSARRRGFWKKTWLGNDFEAQANGLFTAARDQFQLFTGPENAPFDANDGIVGIGTGCGVGGRKYSEKRGRHEVIRAEGGHGSIPWRDPEQEAFLRFVWEHRRNDPDKTNAEAILSGGGLSLIHAFNTNGPVLHPKEVVKVLTAEDWQLFCYYLGLFCESLCMHYWVGRLYLSGGVLMRSKDQFLKETAAFNRGFLYAPALQQSLSQVSVRLLTGETGTFGAAYSTIARI